MKKIKRDVYLIICTKGNGSIKVIIGIRRCGKYYLLSEGVKNTILLNLCLIKLKIRNIEILISLLNILNFLLKIKRCIIFYWMKFNWLIILKRL